MAEFKLPTEVIDLPSKGILYPKDHPLSEGKIEIKYMTAKEEDILSNTTFIQSGVVLDKLLQSLIVTKFNYDDLLIGDKNAIMIAARVLGYGGEYKFTYNGREEVVDLAEIENKKVDPKLWKNGNSFNFTLPHSKNEITFRLLTSKDEKDIMAEIDGIKKINRDNDTTASTRLKYLITSIGGDSSKKAIRDFVDNYLLARDARALREYVNSVNPDIDLTFFPQRSEVKRSIPIGLSLFWPDAG